MKQLLTASILWSALAWSANAAPVSLDGLIQSALDQHPSLQAARQSAAAQAARVGAAQAPNLPQVNLNSSLQYSTNLSNAQTSSQPFALSTAGLTLRQQLYDFGKTDSEVAIARANADISMLAAQSQAVEVAYGVRQAYLQWVRAAQIERLARTRLDSASRLAAQAEAFWKAGKRSKIDATRAAATLAQARAELIAAHTGVEQAQRTLSAAAGQEALVAGEPAFPALPAETSQPLATLEQAALERHPALQTSAVRLHRADATLRSAEKANLPDINLDVNYGLRARDMTPGQNWTAGVGFSMPLFNGFSSDRLRSAAGSELAATEATARDQALTIRTGVQKAYLALAGTRDRLPASQASVASAQENLALAEGRYQSGVGSIIEVSDAQALLASAETELVRAQTDYHLAAADLLRAAGLTGISK
ncbi:Outer membrane protein TolC precursor [compost metagenome]